MRGRVLAGLGAVLVAVGCRSPATMPAPETPPAASDEKEAPPQARFETGFNVLRVTGVSCNGLRGPWRVRLAAPNPIEGQGESIFRLAGGRGPGRMRWSFDASHPGQGQIVYEGNVRVRAVGPTDSPVLLFTGKQTSVGATGDVQGMASVQLGRPCQR